MCILSLEQPAWFWLSSANDITIEEEKVLAGQACSAEANAGMALNNAIHEEFAPYFAEDWETAVENLRRVLKSDN